MAPSALSSHPPFIAKMIDQLDTVWTTMRLARRHRFDILHCRSYFAADVGLKLKRVFCARILRGFWVDEQLEGGRWPQKKLPFRFPYRQYS
jgi:hypothetical protein